MLRGPIPGAALGRLRRLKKVNLSFNQLTGPVPKEICGLKTLRKLLLQDNNLYGPLPDW